MDNNKKQQNFSRSGNTKTSNSTNDSGRQKSSDLQSKHCPKSSRRRENPQASARSNNNSSGKQQQQQQQASAKVRPNVDKRPRARGYYGNSSSINNSGAGSSFFNDNAASSSGLVSGESTTCAFSGEGAVGRFESNNHDYYELNSVYSPGTKKQNLNHLLNFFYTSREVDYYDGVGGSNHSSSNGSRMGHVKKHKYNKEQFLQANFQFVIKASAKRKTDDSPDTLIDWSLIEQINIQTQDELQCPICLYPPVAAKVTRCGHVYCWPCVLHYLSLSDKTWRKCPICYDALHVGDLKSASIVQQQAFNVGSPIMFRLMRRTKGSLLIERYESWNGAGNTEKYPYVSSPMEEKLFSKFILATRGDVADILARERNELLMDVDESCPEFVFIQQALVLLMERSEKLGDVNFKEKSKQYETQDNYTDINSSCSYENNVSAIQSFDETDVSPIALQSGVGENPTQSTAVTIQSGVKENATESTAVYENNVSAIQSFDETDVSPIALQSGEGENPTQSTAVTIQSGVKENASESTAVSSCQHITSSPTSKFYYFYQADDGQNIYLHPINVKMLQACYGSLADAPAVIEARILQKEQHSMDEEHRRKFTCLGHLPLTCQFSVVEVELQAPYVSEDIIQIFKAGIIHRKKERQRRAREERERDKHIDAINARQMGQLIASTANINIASSHEFPTCGFDDSLLNTAQAADTPSTSKGNRKKTNSTSSAGSCSYSSIALNCQQEHSPWTTLNATRHQRPPTAVEHSNSDDGEVSILNSIQTNLGDVLAQALSQKNHKKSEKSAEAANGICNKNKKSKKSKKMLPLYSTGMNFSGN